MTFIDREHVRAEGIRVFPPLIPTAMLLAAWPLGIVAPLAHVGPGVRLAGWIVAGLGALLMAWALVQQYRRGTDPNPFGPTSRLVTDGPYRFSRNPVYVADLLLQTGIGLGLDWGWAIALLPATWLGLRILVIGHEERYLSRTFGDAYDAYCQRVRRWL